MRFVGPAAALLAASLALAFAGTAMGQGGTTPTTTATTTATATAAGTTSPAPTSSTKLFVQADTVASGTCAQTNQFPQGSTVVMRARVVDPATGNQMDNTNLSSVVMSLPNGQSLNLQYAAHPPQGAPNPDHYWTVGWAVPANYPTGTVRFTMTATAKDGRTGQFDPFNVPPSMLTIVAPSAAPSPNATTSPSPAPKPPATGSGTAAAPSGVPFALPLGLAGLVFSATTLVLWSARRSQRPGA